MTFMWMRVVLLEMGNKEYKDVPGKQHIMVLQTE